MKPTHRVFFAIPYDAATKAMYERIAERVRATYAGITTVIGTQEVGPSPGYSSLASFKAQNRELTSQFVAQIRSADIVVADLTHNNPNVHVELGIALLENKNILRVTGRSLTEVGFDIRNLEVHRYSTEAQLRGRILEYIATFLSIKRLSLSPSHGKLYSVEPTTFQLDSLSSGQLHFRRTTQGIRVRDAGIAVTFNLHAASTIEDWFGVYFRIASSFSLGSHLVYVRQNGAVELAVYPGPRVLAVHHLPNRVSGARTLLLNFENDFIDIRVGKHSLRSELLSHQAFGTVGFAAWRSRVTISRAEVIDRDTVEWT